MKAMSGPWRGRVAAAAAVAVTALTVTAVQVATAPAGAAAKTATAKTTAKQDTNQLKQTEKTGDVPGIVVAMLSSASVTGAPLAGHAGLHAPRTSSTAINKTLARFGAKSIESLATGSAKASSALTKSARAATGDAAVNLGGTVLVQVPDGDVTAAAKALAATSGVAFAEPEQYVNTLNTGGTPLTPADAPALKAADVAAATPGASDLPTNYGLASSEQSYLNAQGDDVAGAFATLQDKYGQLPGTGEIITNVSIGDLTDPTMADDPDVNIGKYGTTTILQNGQRYLDLPGMPLIPTYVSEPDGTLSGSAGVAGTGDTNLSEIGLDFSVMAPLPDGDQRTGETNSGVYDLLGIAPGASYRLVEPSVPTDAGIAQALLAAANQTPRPNVITASLGFGTDTLGYPSRYLEEDPLIESVIAGIVHQDGIVVAIAANDGTRLYTPVSVGPDGGATPTNVVASAAQETNIDSDAYSTVPGEVLDSGAIDAGGTTTDDTIAVPPGSSSDWTNAVYAETRTDGGADFASGFGSRVTLSAPSDNITAFVHQYPDRLGEGGPDSVNVELSGGTSAAAPQIAAAAADVLQAARLTGQHYTPAQVTQILEQTGTAVATPPQIDQTLNVGKQIDVTAAVDAVLAAGHAEPSKTSIVRLSVAHQQMIEGDEGTFVEYTDPGYLDMSDDGSDATTSLAVQSGEGLVGPVTFAADITGPRGDSYALVVGKKTFTSTSDYIRVTPTQLLQAAGLPVVSTSDRTITVTYQVLENGKVLAQTSEPLTLSASDGTYSYAQAPVVQPVVQAGKPVTVSYDLRGDNDVEDPELVVSEVGKWEPGQEPQATFTPGYTVNLNHLKGTVTLPASAFDDGQGIYGIGIEQDTDDNVYGMFTPVRVAGFSVSTRPAAPVLTSTSGVQVGSTEVDRSDPDFTMSWDAGPDATGAIMEISAPGPTLYGAENTVDNPNGSQRDDDGNDTESVVYKTLPAAEGKETFNFESLGLVSSVDYNVRIFPTGKGGVIDGQASPTAGLEVDDGLVPDGGTIDSFYIDGSDSVAAISVNGESELVHYDQATATYGKVIATDSDDGDIQIYGVDPAAGTVLAEDTDMETLDPTAGPVPVVTVSLYSLTKNSLIATPDLSGYSVESGRVDGSRDRAAILATDTTTGDDTLVELNMSTGAVEQAIDLDVDGITAGSIATITLDPSNGLVFLGEEAGALGAGNAQPDLSVDLGTGTVTEGMGGTGADEYIDADGVGDNIVGVGAETLSRQGLTNAFLGVTAENGLTRTVADTLIRQGGPWALAVDGQRQEAAVLFDTPNGQSTVFSQLTNVNSMSAVDLIDLGTQSITEELDQFDIDSIANSSDSSNNQFLQLDPSTQTGWTIGPGGTQIQQFSY